MLATHPNGVEVVPVANPRASPIRVALNRMRRCPKEVQVPGVDIVPAEPGGNLGQGDESDAPSSSKPSQELQGTSDTSGGSLWSNRLRPRTSARGRAEAKSGEM